jgi:hypothetical protein
MVATFNITGSIEIDLPEDIIEKFNLQKSETMKKHVLMEYFYNALWGCSLAGKNELDYNVNFDNVEIETDWSKYPGSIVDLNKNDPHGSPLGICVDNTPTTQKEIVENTMKDIANRKSNKKNH